MKHTKRSQKLPPAAVAMIAALVLNELHSNTSIFQKPLNNNRAI